MATLIKNGNGGRCCAKCYNARRPICTCVCGGENHGKGFGRALQNTRDMAREALGKDTEMMFMEQVDGSEEDFGVRVRDDRIFIRSARTLMHKNQLLLFEEAPDE